jgi:hypothetical protein
VISECAADLAARVRSVPALANSAAFALGGKGTDPALKEIPLPAAWLALNLEQVDEDPLDRSTRYAPGIVPEVQMMVATFPVLVIVPYIDETDLITNQYPLLESVVKAVKASGGEAPSGHRWRYIGQRLAFVYPDRLGYEQRYTLNWTL